METKATRIAVAVSGGSDSMAMLHLMAGAAAHEGCALFAVTVDHALRPESAKEAREVARVCAGLGVFHQVLLWEHGAIAGNMMDAARRARYGLMAKWAAEMRVSHVFLGHTADDQAETFLMGLARSAGIDGLVGMRGDWEQGGVRFMRPFLAASRADLRGFLTRRAVAWIDDPSNENEQFTRIKARKALAALAPLGITVDRLNEVVNNLGFVQCEVVEAARLACERLCDVQAGAVVFDWREWGSAGQELRRRLLNAALCWVSGADVPRGSALFRVMMAIEGRQDATLAGCLIRCFEGGFSVLREPKAVTGLVCAPGQFWDGRWQVEGPFAPGQEIRALGAAGLRQCKDWRKIGLNRDMLVVSPAIWHDEALIAAPIAGFPAGFSARIAAPFDEFVLSH